MKTRASLSAFSERLQNWLNSDRPKTLDGLSQEFETKSFAILILILMFIPALPLPTGGISHLFEVIAALLALEIVAGRKSVWLPERWRQKHLGKVMEHKILPQIVSRVRWFERHSSQRGWRLAGWPPLSRVLGLVIIIFTATAFAAPPFSGLDTLPAMGVVLICLGLILEDLRFLLLGLLIGGLGVAIVIGLSKLVIDLLRDVI